MQKFNILTEHQSSQTWQDTMTYLNMFAMIFNLLNSKEFNSSKTSIVMLEILTDEVQTYYK